MNNDFEIVDSNNSQIKDNFYKYLFKSLFTKLALILPLLFLATVFLAGLIFNYFVDASIYTEINLNNAFLSPSSSYWFGTNEYGQNQFYLIMVGCFTTLCLALITSLLNMLIGTLIGILWTHFSKLDLPILFIKSVIDNIPLFFFYIIIISILGNTFTSLIIILIIVGWINIACLVRNNLLLVKNKDYNIASKLYKTPLLKRIANNYLPVVLPVIFNSVALSIPEVISCEITLSYFNLSFISNASLGKLLYSSISSSYYFSHPYLFLIPFLFLVIINLCFFSISRTISKYSSKRRDIND